MAACPMYLKTHSSGEYVFDQNWAHTAMYAGQRYYPKLQCCVPFTPVTGARVLVRAGYDAQVIRQHMAKALVSIAGELPGLTCMPETETPCWSGSPGKVARVRGKSIFTGDAV